MENYKTVDIKFKAIMAKTPQEVEQKLTEFSKSHTVIEIKQYSALVALVFYIEKD